MSILPVSTPRDLRRHIRRIAAVERRAVTTVVGLQAVTTVAGLVGPRILGDIVDDAQAHRPIGVVDSAAAAFLAALVAQTLLTAVTRRRSAVLGERVLAGL